MEILENSGHVKYSSVADNFRGDNIIGWSIIFYDYQITNLWRKTCITLYTNIIFDPEITMVNTIMVVWLAKLFNQYIIVMVINYN